MPVELAVRYPRGGKVRKLGVVDSASVDRWARRLRRRSALGQEILIRPARGTPVMLLPGLSRQHEKAIEEAGIEPVLRVDTEWQRRDLWIRLAADGRSEIAEKPHAVLAAAGIIPSKVNAASWGHLAGYRPDPQATNRSMAVLLVNRIVEFKDSAIELSQELLERLRQLAKGRNRRPEQTDRNQESSIEEKEEGRPR